MLKSFCNLLTIVFLFLRSLLIEKLTEYLGYLVILSLVKLSNKSNPLLTTPQTTPDCFKVFILQ